MCFSVNVTLHDLLSTTRYTSVNISESSLSSKNVFKGNGNSLVSRHELCLQCKRNVSLKRIQSF